LTTANVLTVVTKIEREDDTERLTPTHSNIDNVMKNVNGAALRHRRDGPV